jgi:hypothetical protein
VVTECAPGGRRMGPRALMPDPANMMPLRARTVYRDMGLMVDTSRLPFVASVRFLAGATPDSTLLVFAMSLANRTLNFRRDSNDLVADYHVELTLRRDSTLVRQVLRDEKVRVSSVPETMRRDESIIFQQLLTVPPGIYSVNVVVRDRTSPAYAHFQQLDTVPRFDAPGLGWPMPIYEGTGRAQRGVLPQLVANPRGTTAYGDRVRFYVEGYRLARGTRLAARVTDLDSVELWHDTLALGEGPLASVQFVIKGGVLPLGRAEFQVSPSPTCGLSTDSTRRSSCCAISSARISWRSSRLRRATSGRRRGGNSTARATQVRPRRRTNRSTSTSSASTSRTSATPSPRIPDGRPIVERCTSRSASQIKHSRSPARWPQGSDGSTRVSTRRWRFRTTTGSANIT